VGGTKHTKKKGGGVRLNPQQGFTTGYKNPLKPAKMSEETDESVGAKTHQKEGNVWATHKTKKKNHEPTKNPRAGEKTKQTKKQKNKTANMQHTHAKPLP